MRIFIVVFALFNCIAFADIGVQSDWSGGPGEEGPVTDWGNSFFSSIFVNWFDDTGNLFLEQMASYNHVRQFGDLVWAKPCFLDNDEYPDVFVTNGEDGTKWYRNTSSGSSWGERDFADTNDIEDIVTADIDGDGDFDVFASVGHYGIRGFYWFKRLNDYGTQWEMHEIDLEKTPSRVYSCDMDGDSDLDLIGSYNGKDLSWWENQSNGQTWVKHIISENMLDHSISSIDVSDCDNDGNLDIACGSYSDEIYLFINQGNDTWEFQGIEYVSDGSMFVASFADVDEDNLVDIVTGISGSPSEVLWFRNTGSNENWELHVIATILTGAYPPSVGDVDGDGDIDVIAAIFSSGVQSNFAWWENTDPVNNLWIYHPPIVSEDIYRSNYYAADINQDGNCDVVSYYRYSSNPAANKVAWWDFNSGSFVTETAQLESSILYVYDVNWGNIDWSAITPEGTSVSFEVRSSDDPENMGDWSAVISSPGSLSPYLTNDDSYLQYRVNLLTTDSTVTPVLQNVALSWTTTGIEGSENTDDISLSVFQNPSAGSVRFGINLPSQFNVTLAVYDTSGRIISDLVSTEYSSGTTVVQLDMLQPGTYFCRMQADGQSFTEQFTIIGD
ncbi:MAG: T9SS type A sorting domain-containing protein [Candidatus Sabulitectum sp.]|nr:T9SS type A sorting domain-containing protein [Candidatus Sabulitectum sp.]